MTAETVANLCAVAANSARAAGFNRGMGKGLLLALGVGVVGFGGAAVFDAMRSSKQKQTPAQLPPARQQPISPTDSPLMQMLAWQNGRLIE